MICEVSAAVELFSPNYRDAEMNRVVLFKNPDGHAAGFAVCPEEIGDGDKVSRDVFLRGCVIEFAFPVCGVPFQSEGADSGDFSQLCGGVFDGDRCDWRESEVRQVFTVVAFFEAEEDGAAHQCDFACVMSDCGVCIDSFHGHMEQDGDGVAVVPGTLDVCVAFFDEGLDVDVFAVD